VLAFTSGGIAVAQPGHQDGKGRFPDTIMLPNGFRPEGISIGKGTTFYVGSVGTGEIYRGDVRTGKGAVFIPAAETAGFSVGTEVDQRNRLWVAGGPTGTGRVYDADSGKLLEPYQFVPAGTATFINDVVVTRSAAYFTDSTRAVLYVVPIGHGGKLGSEFQTLPLTGAFEQVAGVTNINGIEASPDGRTLFVVPSNSGLLFTISPKTGFTKQVDLGGATLVHADGLLLQGRSILYAVQNSDNKIAVVKLNRSYTSGKVVDTITSEGNFDVPTTIAPFGKSLYAVNARFSTPPTPDTTYTVVRVDAFKGH
jgi:sugar lactone lactonase YvrE